MRYQLPQFIDVEDKIVGMLTARQFGWFLLGVVCCVPAYFLASRIIFFITSAFILGIAAVFAFLRPYGRSFSAYLVSVITFFAQPKLFLWNKTIKPAKPETVKTQSFTPDFAKIVEDKRKDISDKRLKLLADKLDADAVFNGGNSNSDVFQTPVISVQNQQLIQQTLPRNTSARPNSSQNPYSSWS
jgi:hypothetical protein